MSPRFAVRVGAPEPLGPARRAALGLEVTITYLRVRWFLGRVPVEKAVSRVRPTWAGRAENPDEVGLTAAEARSARRLARATITTLTFLPADSRCLYRAIVLSALLARRSIDSSVVVGVQTEPRFQAHAWVECAGRALLPSGGYARLTHL